MSNYSQALQNLQNIYDEFNAKIALHKEKETVLLQENAELKSCNENLTSENSRLKKEKVNETISDGKKKKLAQVDLQQVTHQDPPPSLASQSPREASLAPVSSQLHSSREASLAPVSSQLHSSREVPASLHSSREVPASLHSSREVPASLAPVSSQLHSSRKVSASLHSPRDAPASLHSRASATSRASKGTGVMTAQEVPSNSLEDDVEVLQITLNSGSYYWNQENGDLYPLNDTSGDSIGKLKVVKIRGVPYYVDTTDNNIYEFLKNSEIGSKCGNIVNNKAAFDRKYVAK